jgi:hypothetical protein
MLDISIIISVVLIICLASFIRSIFGFGDALVAMPLLSMVIDIQIAAPLVSIVALTIGLTILVQNRSSLQISNLWKIILYATIGIPVGIFLLTGLNENLMKILLGSLIVSYSFFSLFLKRLNQITDSNLVNWGLGFAAGVFGGAYNIAGPPIVILGNMKQWSSNEFRTNLQGLFIPIGFILVLSRAATGLFTLPVLMLTATALPVTILAILFGDKISQKIPERRFNNLVYWLIAVLGVMLISQAIVKL